MIVFASASLLKRVPVSSFLLLFTLLLGSCHTTDKKLTYPDENRFKKVVLAGEKEGLKTAAQFDFGSDGRIYIIEMTGAIKIFDQHTGKLNTAGFIPTHDGGEHGLIGMKLDPDFNTNGYIYLQYFIKDTVRLMQISRFSIVDDSLLLSSEKVFIKVPYEITCCHTGGGMDFDTNGNLYASTGDNTEAGSGWTVYSPHDDSPGHTKGDALRSAGNTNDYRGKILRIHPEKDGSYTIPEGNLFPKGTANTKPEIYIMGLRNPFRINIDRSTNYLYWGEVGPDAGTDSTRGQRGYDEFNQAREAGNFGWPLFIGNNKPYTHVYFNEQERIGEKFDTLSPINFSKNNTGLQELPKPHRAAIWYPYNGSEEFPALGSGGRTAIGGPIYRYDPDLKSPVKFPEYFDRTWFVADWMRNWIKAIHIDGNNNVAAIDSFMTGSVFRKPMFMKFGPDGALYVLEYGTTWSFTNPDLQLVKIEYQPGNRPPVAQLQITNNEFLTVDASAENAIDFDHDSLKYSWTDEKGNELGNGVRTKISFSQPGRYTIRLAVKDDKEATDTKDTTIWVGTPHIGINLPNRSFYGDNTRYEVVVRNPAQASPGINIDSSVVRVTMQQLTQGGANAGATHFRGEVMVNESDCNSCHQLDKKSAGPSFQEIANKYKGNKATISTLAQKIISGGGGVWGELNMSAHPQLSVAQSTAMVEYIYSLANAKSAPITVTLKGYLPVNNKQNNIYLLQADYAFDAGPLSGLTLKDSVLLRSPVVTPLDFEKLYNAEIEHGLLKAKYGSRFCIKQVDLTGIKKIEMKVRGDGGRVEVRLNSENGQLAGQAELNKQGEQVITALLKEVTDKHDLYFVFFDEGDNWGTRIIYVQQLLFVN